MAHYYLFELLVKHEIPLLLLLTDRFVVGSKRPAPAPSSDSVRSPSNKKPGVSSKQGNFTANIRVTEFGRDVFNADGGKLFCHQCNLVIDHFWKHTITKHLGTKVILIYVRGRSHITYSPEGREGVCK